MKCIEYKGYVGSVEVDFDGNFLHGKLLHIRDLVTYEGASPEEVKRAFEESVDFYLEDCAEAGEEPDKPFKGSFNVRISPELHKELAMSARSSDRSLNDYVGFILRNHQTFETHRKAAEHASEAAWTAFSGFGHFRIQSETSALVDNSKRRESLPRASWKVTRKTGATELRPLQRMELLQ